MAKSTTLERDAPTRNANFTGYYQDLANKPDLFLTQVGRGTPGGEYLRRFWHPVAYLEELTDVPLRVRALGEDLVAYRDKSGRIGLLHLHCCHRNSSLEFGIVEEQGLRCCYHGRLFAADGEILETPGEPDWVRTKSTLRQGAYPTRVFAGIVFAYMGPPDRIPVFPEYDRFSLPGVQLVPGPRWHLDCNWLQLQENALDPAHTATLHAIPQLRGMDHFAAEFGNFPELITWSETPGGFIYMAARHVGGNVWVRSAETLGPHMRCISSIFESGETQKQASQPFCSFWLLPVDDDVTCNFYVSHVGEDEPIPFETRRELECFGQTEDRPYRERQFIPGDHEAQASQGRINNHGLENLATMDRGVMMFRRYLRRNIQAVQRGQDPHAFYLDQTQVPPTFANDFVVDAAEVDGNPDDPQVLEAFCQQLVRDYKERPPMAELCTHS